MRKNKTDCMGVAAPLIHHDDHYSDTPHLIVIRLIGDLHLASWVLQMNDRLN